MSTPRQRQAFKSYLHSIVCSLHDRREARERQHRREWCQQREEFLEQERAEQKQFLARVRP